MNGTTCCSQHAAADLDHEVVPGHPGQALDECTRCGLAFIALSNRHGYDDQRNCHPAGYDFNSRPPATPVEARTVYVNNHNHRECLVMFDNDAHDGHWTLAAPGPFAHGTSMVRVLYLTADGTEPTADVAEHADADPYWLTPVRVLPDPARPLPDPARTTSTILHPDADAEPELRFSYHLAYQYGTPLGGNGFGTMTVDRTHEIRTSADIKDTVETVVRPYLASTGRPDATVVVMSWQQYPGGPDR